MRKTGRVFGKSTEFKVRHLVGDLGQGTISMFWDKKMQLSRIIFFSSSVKMGMGMVIMMSVTVITILIKAAALHMCSHTCKYFAALREH